MGKRVPPEYMTTNCSIKWEIAPGLLSFRTSHATEPAIKERDTSPPGMILHTNQRKLGLLLNKGAEKMMSGTQGLLWSTFYYTCAL